MNENPYKSPETVCRHPVQEDIVLLADDSPDFLSQLRRSVKRVFLGVCAGPFGLIAFACIVGAIQSSEMLLIPLGSSAAAVALLFFRAILRIPI